MDALQQIPLTANLTKAVLAVGTTTTLSTTNAATYAIKGKLYKQGAAWTNQATPTTDEVTGNAFTAIQPNQGGVFTIGIDHSGTMKVVQGGIQALDVNGNFINAPQFGGLGPVGSGSTDNDFCPLGYVVVKCGSTASAWTFGSSNFSGPPTGVTFAFQDCATLPDRPQVS